MASIISTEYAIKREYLNAVQNFDLSGSSALPSSVSEADLDALVDGIVQRIVDVRFEKERISARAGRDLSLLEVFYIQAQASDLERGANRTITIQNASSDQRTILSHACRKLETKLAKIQIEKIDIRAATILFGINIPAKAMSVNEMLQKRLEDVKGAFHRTSLIEQNMMRNTEMLNPSELVRVRWMTSVIERDISNTESLISFIATLPKPNALTTTPATPEPASAPAEASPAVAPAKKDA